ncbi:MAG: hydrogenase, partial [Candidatus Omnitrophica bacterium]|nr:hydrogenase [Candidatus Omnitrophota bacterium]
DFLLELFERMPKGEILTPMGPLKGGQMVLSMVEGWRGEIIHVAITDSNSQIARYKIKDPSFNNWTALSLAVRGAQISDFPLCNKSFNLSYAGHDL